MPKGADGWTDGQTDSSLALYTYVVDQVATTEANKFKTPDN